MSDINLVEYNLDFTVEEEAPINIEYNYGNVTVITTGTQVEEELIGTIDGLNKVFTTSENFITGSTRLFINGLKQRLGLDYVESASNAVTLSEAPTTIGFTDSLIINYMKEL